MVLSVGRMRDRALDQMPLLGQREREVLRVRVGQGAGERGAGRLGGAGVGHREANLQVLVAQLNGLVVARGGNVRSWQVQLC
jgi:hypothetical protein